MRYSIVSFFGSKILRILLLVLGFFLFGTLGFMWFEGFRFLDALWLTTITLSTVGYETLKPLSDSGKIFSIILIVGGIGMTAYALSLIAQEIVDGKFMERYKKNKMDNQISKFKDHIIICGFGRCGKQAGRRIHSQKISFIIIDKDIKALNLPEEFKNVPYIEGDATSDEVLDAANIKHAKALITALPSDAENLFIVLSARQRSPNLLIIARASNTTSISKLKMAGADNVIMPEQIGGEQMASLIAEPELYEFVDEMFLDNYDGANMIILRIQGSMSKFVGSSIGDIQKIKALGCKVIGLKNDKGQFTVNPAEDTLIQENFKLIVLGNPEQIYNLRNATF